MIASDPAGLIGRVREFDRIIALLDAAVAYRGGGAVSITGEPGIGKSALVGAVVEHARASGWAVLEGRGHDLEGLLAFGPLAAALGGHLHRLPRARRRAYTEGLSSLGSVVEGLGDPAAPADRSRIFQAVALLLGRIAADAPVLLVVDDLHWADPATVDVLRYLSADLDALGVVLLVALRTATTRPDVRGLVSTLARLPRHDAVTLRRLDRAGVAAMAGDLLGGAVGAPLVDLVERRSAGTPLVVQALVHDLRARGALHAGPDGWACAEADPDTPAHLLDLFGAGLDRLPAATRQVLELVCLGGEPVPHTRLAALSGDGDGDLARQVDDLRAAGLLVEDARHGRVRYAPAHPVVADAALARLGEAARTGLHARFVAVLEREGAVASDVLARHHLGARDVVGADRAREVLAAAGLAALRRAAPDTALRWLAAAADLAAGDPATLGPVLVDLGLARQLRGDTAGAVADLREATALLDRAGERARAAAASVMAARLAWLVDDLAGARRSSALTLELARAADPATRAGTIQAHALQLTCMGDDPAPVHELLDRADADVAEVAEAGTRGRLAGFGTYVRMVAGVGSASDALAALRPTGPCSPDHRLELTSSNARLELVVLLGRWPELDAELATAQALGERGVGPLRAWRSPLAEFHRRFATGDWSGADDLVTELADAPWRANWTVELHVLRTWMALHRGAVTGPADIGHPDDGAPRGPDRDLYRVLHALAGAPGEPPRGYLVMFEWWRQLARVRAARRDRSALRAVADDLDRVGGPGSAPAALAHRARALAAADRGETARHAALAAAAFDALGMPVDAAAARIEGAERGAGRDGIAADLVLLDRLGARPLADRARALLGRPAAAPTRPVLTPREREVAELVTDGLSNAAIADRLVVSVRTVTSHLDHVYTKLGIGSRTELARQIRDT